MIRRIEGRHNRSIKLARKLQKKKHRRERRLFVAEGMDLVEAADAVGRLPAEVLVREDLLEVLPARVRAASDANEVEIGVCGQEVLRLSGGLGGASDVVALYPMPDRSLADVDLGTTVVYLHEVGDPGNVGAMVRSTLVFGGGGLICSPHTADPYSPKALRAGMGAQFELPVVTDVGPADLEAKLKANVQRGGHVPPILVAAPHHGTIASDVSAGDGAVLVLGSERGELPEFSLPIECVQVAQERFDSLNLAIAGSILLYELNRDRLGKAMAVC